MDVFKQDFCVGDHGHGEDILSSCPRQDVQGMRKALPAALHMASPQDAETEFDVAMGTAEFLNQVLECLMLKAFCVIDASMCGALGGLALRDFVAPPSAPGVHVADGLLGLEGSARIRELPTQDETCENPQEEEVTEHTWLWELDELFAELGARVADGLPSLASEEHCRSPTLIHTTGAAAGPTTSMTEDVALGWADIFSRHRLMMVFFAGKGRGILELGFFDEYAAEPQKVLTRPGVMIVLRPEVISRRYYSRTLECSLAFSCFLLTTRARSSSDPPPPPISDELLQWHQRRQEPPPRSHFLPNDLELETGWQNSKEAHVCVRGDACRLPGMSWSSALFFEGCCVGTDFVIEVPTMRFHASENSYEETYEAGAEQRVISRHCSFIDGADLFDHDLFSMDAHQALCLPTSVRVGLEASLEATTKAGFNCGRMQLPEAADVLVGMHASDNQNADSFINAGRYTSGFETQGSRLTAAEDHSHITYTLNLKGQSHMFDTDGSSSLVALWKGCGLQTESTPSGSDCSPSPPENISAFSLVLASAWIRAPSVMDRFASRGLLGRRGRCFCFDEGADGFVRAEGCVAAVLARIHGGSQDWFSDDEDSPMGAIRSVALVQSGKGSAVAQAVGLSMQEVMDTAVQSARIDLHDVNAIECHSPGSALHDGMEARSVQKVFSRSRDAHTFPLTSGKSNLGDGYAMAGLVAVLRVLAGTRRAAFSANIMVTQLNAYIELHKQSQQFALESCTQPCGSSGLTSVNSFGNSGTYATAVVWGDVARAWVRLRNILPREVLAKDQLKVHNARFFDIGEDGGEWATLSPTLPCYFDVADVPERGYFIVGTFSHWSDPYQMKEAAPGEFVAVIVLGENRWEDFQILIDGDDAKVLHPDLIKAKHGCAAVGPLHRELCSANCWEIDGRSHSVSAFASNHAIQDVGAPGDLYKVRLRTFGLHRSVDWEKVPSRLLSPVTLASLRIAPSKPSAYYVMGNWSDFEFEEMENDTLEPDLWHCIVDMIKDVGVFAIIRNRDWSQVFYPESTTDDAMSNVQVCGPSDSQERGARSWIITAEAGSYVQITFRRNVTVDTDDRQVSWHMLQWGD